MCRQSGRLVFAATSRCLAVPENIRLRVESFGGIAFDKLTGTLVELDRDAMAMLQCVRTAGAVPEDAVTSRFADHGARVVVGRLLDLGILDVVSSGYSGVSTLTEPTEWPSRLCLTAPETVHWAITYRCDQQCPDCYARRYSSRFEDELDTMAAMRLVDILAGWGVFQLAVGGGEPLLRRDLAQICRHAQRSGLVVHVTTGYHSVDRELLRSLERSISTLQIGVKHGRLLADPSSESSQLSETVQSADDCGIRVGANLMLCNTVLAHFDEITDFLAQTGVCRITLLRYKPPVDQSQWTLENPPPGVWRRFEELLRNVITRYPEVVFRVDCALSFLQRKLSSDEATARGIRGCMAGERILALTPNASAYPCSQLVRSGLRAGNLLTDNPTDLWAGSNALRVTRTFRDSREFDRSQCGICGASMHCGGCRAFTDDCLAGDPGCPEAVC